MKEFFAAISLTSLLLFPAHIQADTIILKGGRQINATKCWEDGELIKCKQYGAIVGYQKKDIMQVAPKPVKKKKKNVRVNQAKSIDLYRLDVAFEIQKAWNFDPGLSKIWLTHPT